jgi:hypothetical protein
VKWLAALVVLTAITAGGVAARADAKAEAKVVALLPLDADQQLEIYGQPVASAVASALRAGGVEVTLVGPKSSVPKDVMLILDGTITAGKSDIVTLSIRVRDPLRDIEDVTVSADPAVLTAIDHAAAQLAGRVLPAVNSQLEAIARIARRNGGRDTTTPRPSQGTAPAAPLSPLVLAVVPGPPGPPGSGPGPAAIELAGALTRATDPWARRHQREPQPPPAASFPGAPLDLVQAVVGGHAPLGLALEVVTYTPLPARDKDAPVTARARVRARLASATTILFDRVIVTDTVVGERAMASDALADRVAREVLGILDPHLLRTVPSWGR